MEMNSDLSNHSEIIDRNFSEIEATLTGDRQVLKQTVYLTNSLFNIKKGFIPSSYNISPMLLCYTSTEEAEEIERLTEEYKKVFKGLYYDKVANNLGEQLKIKREMLEERIGKARAKKDFSGLPKNQKYLDIIKKQKNKRQENVVINKESNKKELKKITTTKTKIINNVQINIANFGNETGNDQQLTMLTQVQNQIQGLVIENGNLHKENNELKEKVESLETKNREIINMINAGLSLETIKSYINNNNELAIYSEGYKKNKHIGLTKEEKENLKRAQTAERVRRCRQKKKQNQ